MCRTTSARAQPLLYETVALGDKTPSSRYQGRALRAAVEPTMPELWAGVLILGRELTGHSVGTPLSD